MREGCFYTLLDELGDPASIMLDSSSSEKLSSGVVKHAQNLFPEMILYSNFPMYQCFTANVSSNDL